MLKYQAVCAAYGKEEELSEPLQAMDLAEYRQKRGRSWKVKRSTEMTNIMGH